MRQGILDVWVEIDPKQTFLALSNQENPNYFYISFYGLMTAWARESPTDLLNNLQLIPKRAREVAISLAVAALVQSGSVNEAELYLKELKVQGEPVRSAVQEFVVTLSRTDPSAAIEWIGSSTETPDYFREILLIITLPKLALVNPVEAMRISHEHPYDESNPYSGMDDDVIRALAFEGRFDDATEMLEQVREPMRLQSYSHIGSAFIEFGRPEDAIALAQELSSTARKDYFGRITQAWLTFDPEHLMQTLADLPDQDTREIVAMRILILLDSIPHLSLEQKEYVKNLLPSLDGS